MSQQDHEDPQEIAFDGGLGRLVARTDDNRWMEAFLGLILLAGSAGLVVATALDFPAARSRQPGRPALRGIGCRARRGRAPGAARRGRVEWVVVAPALGALFPLHARLLFAGEGPLRVKGDLGTSPGRTLYRTRGSRQ